MCKIMFVINNNENDNASNLISANEYIFKGEKDGNSVLIQQEDEKPKVSFFDTTKNALKNLIKESKNKGIFGIHTRTGTSGLMGKINLHFWKKHNYFFAHNGFVFVLDKMSKKKCDSKMFFEFLMADIKNTEKKRGKEITPSKCLKIIEKNIEKFDFMGVAVLYNSKRGIVYIMGTRNINLTSDSKNFLAFTSFEPLTSYTKIKEYSGFSFMRDNAPSLLDKTELEKGLYAYDIKKRKIIADREVKSRFEFDYADNKQNGYFDKEDKVEQLPYNENYNQGWNKNKKDWRAYHSEF